MNVLIVEARYHPVVIDALLDGATLVLERCGAYFERMAVPGALEIPAAISLAARAHRFEGFLALGSVVQTGTPHFELIAGNAFSGLTRLGADHGLCIGNGIVVALNEDEALRMALKHEEDAGGDAARACLALVTLAQRLGGQA
jgi:6,7-dimethyl-8-ribityllumazine synthase